MASFTGWRPPRWVWQLLGAGAVVVGGLWWIGRRAGSRRSADERAEVAASEPRRQPGQRFLVLAGRARAGKSAVANALLGTDLFGSEAPLDQTAQFLDSWLIRELPCGAVNLGDHSLIQRQVGPDDAVVLVIDEQPFHADLAFLETLREERAEVPRLVFINKADLLAAQYTAAEAELLHEAVRKSLAPYVAEPDDVVWGSGAGDGRDVAALQARLKSVLS
ncbi:MAG: GTPase domain-containing protein [Armatimonadetes bacterium]|nr:GTPase domain-containing protein [Armatimonadota bacterium]